MRFSISTFVALLLIAVGGCHQANSNAAKQAGPRVLPASTAEEIIEDDKVVLGSPRLLAGIPGQGDLQDWEIEAWLANDENHQPLDWILPPHLRGAAAQVWIPDDNPLTRAKIELGRQLFFDRRLSDSRRNFSCADCHHPRDQFAHPGHNLDLSEPGIRRAVPVVYNRILSRAQFWDGRADSLEAQAIMPILDKNEMANTEAACVETLRKIPGYRMQFEKIFGGVSLDAVGKALACFQRALVVGAAPYDQARLAEGTDPAEVDDYSPAAVRGAKVFQRACSRCHSGDNFTDEQYHRILPNEKQDPGRYGVTHDEPDRFSFKTPTLRNIARTAPYMHRGQLGTLEDVIALYGREFDDGPTADEAADLVVFLRALTGPLPELETGRLPK